MQRWPTQRHFHGYRSLTREEFERLYAAESPLLVAQLKRVYHALSEEVDDVVQDAFHRLWSRSAQGNEGALRDAGKWVYRVANNAMIDLARGRRVRKFVSLEEEREGVNDASGEEDVSAHDIVTGFDATSGHAAGESYEAELSHERRRQAMIDALEKLSPMQKTLLIELYVNGRSYDDLAKISGLARGALGTTLLRARRAALRLAHEYLERTAMNADRGVD